MEATQGGLEREKSNSASSAPVAAVASFWKGTTFNAVVLLVSFFSLSRW